MLIQLLAIVLCLFGHTAYIHTVDKPLSYEQNKQTDVALIQQLDTQIHELSYQLQEASEYVKQLLEQRRLIYQQLCTAVVNDVLQAFKNNHQTPDIPSACYELSGPLTEVNTYQIRVTYSHEKPHIVAQTRFEHKLDIRRRKGIWPFTIILTPIIEVGIPIKDSLDNLLFQFLSPNQLSAILAHEIGHIWHFDAAITPAQGIKTIAAIVAELYILKKIWHYRNTQYLNTLLLWMTQVGIEYIYTKDNIARGRFQESRADLCIPCMRIPAIKSFISFLMRNELYIELLKEQPNNYISRYCMQKCIQMLLVLDPHPRNINRITAMLHKWHELRTKELMSTQGVSDASATAQQEITEQFHAMINGMHELQPEHITNICKETFALKLEDEVHKTHLIACMNHLKEKLHALADTFVHETLPETSRYSLP